MVGLQIAVPNRTAPRRLVRASLAILNLGLLLILCGLACSPKAQTMRTQARVRAPELAPNSGWLNTDRPLSLTALRGKVVLLDFWTYGCINCIHIIPDLKRLEKKYANQLVVIGVHSAKFENERETENIRRIILRYGIEHPVVNDASFAIWQSYAVRGWPTLVLIDPEGYIAGTVTGEGHYELLDRAIDELVAEFRRRGKLNEEPLSFALERAKVGDTPLAFPGKILADEKSQRLFIADSNHHRIVVARFDGTLIETIGTGAAGMIDGPTDRATFKTPQGLALDGDMLYVADTGNHAIRRIDLKARRVETIAGTGEQLTDYSIREGDARATALSSPWDLQLIGRKLYIAMAGPHQIWQLDLDRGKLSVFAGSGVEARADGTREEAAFAQPSGLATDGRTLYVADSESNIIRAIDLATDGRVRTLAGGDLFDFGDRDGRGDEARFQHPLGIAYRDGALYIADTYNHKIRRLDPLTRTVTTFAGTGRPGHDDGRRPSFYEPGGLSVASDKIYVADTNNHAVRVIDLRNAQTSTLPIKGLAPPRPTEERSTAYVPAVAPVTLPRKRVRKGETAVLVLDIALPSGYHLNPFAPQRASVKIEKGDGILELGAATRELIWRGQEVALPLRVPLRPFRSGEAEITVQATLYYCREDNTGLCRVRSFAWHIPLESVADESAPHEVRLQAQIDADGP